MTLEGSTLTRKYNTLLDKHSSTSNIKSYTKDTDLSDKLKLLLEELRRYQTQQDNSGKV